MILKGLPSSAEWGRSGRILTSRSTGYSQCLATLCAELLNPSMSLRNTLSEQSSAVQPGLRPPPLLPGVGLRTAETAYEELFGRGGSSGAATAQHTANLVRRRTVELADQGSRESTNGLVGSGVFVGIVTNPFGDNSGFVNWGACDVNRVSFRQRLEGDCITDLNTKGVDSPANLPFIEIRFQVNGAADRSPRAPTATCPPSTLRPAGVPHRSHCPRADSRAGFVRRTWGRLRKRVESATGAVTVGGWG